MSEIAQQDLLEGLDRLARTRDGVLLYRYLQQILCAVPIAEAPESALRLDQGRRTLASELMAVMAAGIETHDRPDAIVTFVRSGPKPRPDLGRGAGRRITADTYVAGWDGPIDTA